jgi:gamma-glutamyl-gamma-aminobutyrate hydrolase PuuD
MKVIAVSQRVVMRTEQERCDALDQQWVVLLERAGFFPVLLPNRLVEVETFLETLSVTGLLLTGGNDLAFLQTESAAPERDCVESLALRYTLEKAYPVLGVCRGAQFLVHFFGGDLRPVEHHAGTVHPLLAQPCQFGAVPSAVRSFHNFGFTEADLPAGFEPIATANDGVVEAIQHATQPIVGTMWHPEREPEFLDQSLSMLQKIFL